MSKRKRVVLNFQQKLEVLKQLNEGKSGSVLAKEYGIGTSTITDLKRNEAAILQFVSNFKCEDQISEKKTRKTAQNTSLDSSVYKWYCEARKMGLPLPDAAVCAKALEINKQLNGNENFKASLGWLRHFKNRHGIKETRDKEQEEESSWVNIGKQLRNVIKREGYTLENVYNADDGFLLWKTLPGDNKDSTSVVSVIACTNANASHKLPLCVIGRDKKGQSHSTLSVIYKIQDNADMNTSFFGEWFENVFIPEVRNRQEMTSSVGKILLIIDDVSWHPHRDILVKNRTDIDIFIVPDKLTPTNQPMEMEINRFKTIYRTRLLKLLCAKSPYPIKQFVEEFSLKESILVIGEAWDSIPNAHIVQSWGTLFSNVKNDTECGNNEVSEIAAIAQRINGLEHCRDEEIIQWLESDKEYYFFMEVNDERVQELEESETAGEGPSDIEAYRCCETVIQWFSRQENCNREQLSILESVRDLAAHKLCVNLKQEID